MTNRWLACGLMLPFALWGSNAYGGDCGRPYQHSCAAPYGSYSAPMNYSYAATPSTSYSMPMTYGYSMPVTYSMSYAAPAYSYAAPMMMVAPGAQAQGLDQNCAGEVTSQSAILATILPLVLPRLIDRLFPSRPDAPPAADTRRLDRIEERLDRIEAKIGIASSGNGDLIQNENRPFAAAQSVNADQATQQIMKGISQIQQSQASLQTQLMGVQVYLSRNTAELKKVEGFLESKFQDEFKNYAPPKE